MLESDELLRRKIIHIDMDAFFASIEQYDHPEYRGLPVIVGGTPENRGVVSTASYEARRYGIHSAMPAKTARRLCPNGIFISGNMARYREVSNVIRNIFYRVTDLVEPLSIDEAFLDVTENKLGERSATRTAMRIQSEIRRETGLTASAGVSYNKFLAKIASDWRKPAGLTVITPQQAVKFIDQLPIERFYGVGAASAKKFRELGITNGLQLRAVPLELLIEHFGKVGVFYYRIVRGVDDRPVSPNESRKSMGREITLPVDCSDREELYALLHTLAGKVALLLAREKLSGRTITLKLRYADFSTITRSETQSGYLSTAEELETVGRELFDRNFDQRKIRLMGLTVSGFPEIPPSGMVQMELPLEFQ